MVALKLLLAAALLGSLIWTLINPGYEPITAVIIAAGCLLAIRVNERAQKDKRTYKPEND
ncbi:hypothetical protein [Methylophilus sp.]|uniref:hypothetical protein n=1 Tax=Methylophilus sp. TaxID=29541 RepID=UPI000D46DE68|nr:hypothetical protein [Methylophilus sp.]PPD10590.1 MAG: hypothetical protein CTY26_13000 [Methylophilus sp.]